MTIEHPQSTTPSSSIQDEEEEEEEEIDIEKLLEKIDDEEKGATKGVKLDIEKTFMILIN